MTATYLSLFQKPETETLEATRHFSQTLRLINHDLGQPNVKESTIAVVVTLIIHSNLIGDGNKSQIHLDGLERVLAVRPGGLPKLGQVNRSLMHKICRTDVDVAMLQGTATRFGSLMAPTRGVIVTSLLKGSIRNLPSPLIQLCSPLRSITQDVLALCRQPGRSRMEPFHYQDILISISQRLLDFAPLKERRPPNMLDDVWHLGLLAFVTTIIYPTGCLREVHCTHLHYRLRDCVDLTMGYPSIYIWLVFMCGLTVSEDETWPIEKLRESARYSTKKWEQVKASLQPFPWISVVHDSPGKAFWEKIHQPGP